jgi:hypothetical protein
MGTNRRKLWGLPNPPRIQNTPYGGFIYGGFGKPPFPHTSFVEVKYMATDCDAGRLYTSLLLVILGERSEPQKNFLVILYLIIELVIFNDK